MRAKCWVLLGILLLALPAMGAKRKKQPERGMLERMEAVPCGAKEKGFTGLGSIFGSVGIQDVHSTEKLCPNICCEPMRWSITSVLLTENIPPFYPWGKKASSRSKRTTCS